jgi:hypothetical protein
VCTLPRELDTRDPVPWGLLRKAPEGGKHSDHAALELNVENHSIVASMSKDIKKRWTPEEDQRLLELKAAGKANAVIGHALRRSTTSINTRLRTLKTGNLKRADALRDRRVLTRKVVSGLQHF